jgi:hypothetical protein
MLEGDTILEIWDVLRAYIPDKEKQEAADHLIPLIVDMEMPESDFQKLVKSDTHLEEAAQEYLEEEEDEDNNDTDDWR